MEEEGKLNNRGKPKRLTDILSLFALFFGIYVVVAHNLSEGGIISPRGSWMFLSLFILIPLYVFLIYKFRNRPLISKYNSLISIISIILIIFFIYLLIFSPLYRTVACSTGLMFTKAMRPKIYDKILKDSN